MAEITFRHEMDCDEETFWEKCHFDEEYNRRLFMDVLHFPSFKLLEVTKNGSLWTRRVYVEPPVAGLPGPLKKVVGDKLSYVEVGTYDKSTGRCKYHVTPSTAADKTKTSGEIYVEVKGPKKIVRVARLEVEVKIFMVGGLLEEKIINDAKASYDAAAKFTNEYVKEKGY